MNVRYSAWWQAMRLRTLPLSVAGILIGSSAAVKQGAFDWMIFSLILATAAALQVLSNFANDYGDSQHGADNSERQGPKRAVQANIISKNAMRMAIVVTAFLCLLLGSVLLFFVFPLDEWNNLVIWFAVGLLSIGAAVGYTMGRLPFGYYALGDVAVFLFFGIVAVVGTHFLMLQTIENTIWLAATSSGFFCVSVLNINNIRDLESDQRAGKRTVAGFLNSLGASWYQLTSTTFGMLLFVIYAFFNEGNLSSYLFCLTFPLFIYNTRSVFRYRTSPKSLDPYLKQMAVSYFLLALLWFLGIWLA